MCKHPKDPRNNSDEELEGTIPDSENIRTAPTNQEDHLDILAE